MNGEPRHDGREKRPWLAALLSFLWPGLGHAYLRAWARALLWVLLLVTVTIAMIPPSIEPATVSVDAFLDAYAQIPASVSIVVFGLTVLCSLDAYRLAKNANASPTVAADDEAMDIESCPSCGKELDEDLDFCPWCSYRLIEPAEESDADE